jgi:hypothetical protein
MPRRLFHYTTATRFKAIIADQKIKPATAGVPENEKPTTWFSFRQDWEPTATPLIGNQHPGRLRRPTFRELAELDTPFRIEIDPATAPLDWPAWREASGVYPDTARALKRAAKKQKADVSDWRMSFEPVKWKDFVAIEAYVDGQWRDLAEVMAVSPANPTPILG